MKALLYKYRLVIKFIITFLLVYFVLTMSHKLYLDFSDGSKFYPDYMTNLVARQSNALINTLGYTSEVLPHPYEPSMKMIINNKFVARIVEGCNSLSVIILFVSFIIAFSVKFKPTFFYIISGSVIIYTVNLLRVALISIGLYHYPWRHEIIHGTLFPLVIYGLVFLLWVFWVNRFAKVQKK